MRFRLIPHPSGAETPFVALTVDVRRSARALELRYRLIGAAGALKAGPLATPARADALWRTTCFEAFLRPRAGPAYVEFNFSPSGRWAAYRFQGYRRGMANADLPAPEIEWSRAGRVSTLTARVNPETLGVSPSARLGLSAVLETQGGTKSHWALAHAGAKPDFHRAEAFLARLPLERAS